MTDSLTVEREATDTAGTSHYRAKNSGITAGEQPTANRNAFPIYATDSTDAEVIHMDYCQRSNGDIFTGLSVRNRASSASAWNSVHYVRLVQALNGTNSVEFSDKGAWLDALLAVSGARTTIQSLTSATITAVTIPTTGWYEVVAINTSTSGACSAYMNSNSTFPAAGYIAATETPIGTYKRAVAGPILLKKGTTIYCRATFTDTGVFCRIT